MVTKASAEGLSVKLADQDCSAGSKQRRKVVSFMALQIGFVFMDIAVKIYRPNEK